MPARIVVSSEGGRYTPRGTRPIGGRQRTKPSDLITELQDLENGFQSAPNLDAAALHFAERYPIVLAKARRLAGITPARDVRGHSRAADGYFQVRLSDGTKGYLQRRTDDCLQAGLASLLQLPPWTVPDFDIMAHLAVGWEPDQIIRRNRDLMNAWLAENGASLSEHSSRPKTGRWLGVVENDGEFSGHVLLMGGTNILFDPATQLPGRDAPQSPLEWGDISYAITID